MLNFNSNVLVLRIIQYRPPRGFRTPVLQALLLRSHQTLRESGYPAGYLPGGRDYAPHSMAFCDSHNPCMLHSAVA